MFISLQNGVPVFDVSSMVFSVDKGSDQMTLQWCHLINLFKSRLSDIANLFPKPKSSKNNYILKSLEGLKRDIRKVDVMFFQHPKRDIYKVEWMSVQHPKSDVQNSIEQKKSRWYFELTSSIIYLIDVEVMLPMFNPHHLNVVGTSENRHSHWRCNFS